MQNEQYFNGGLNCCSKQITVTECAIFTWYKIICIPPLISKGLRPNLSTAAIERTVDNAKTAPVKADEIKEAFPLNPID